MQGVDNRMQAPKSAGALSRLYSEMWCSLLFILSCGRAVAPAPADRSPSRCAIRPLSIPVLQVCRGEGQRLPQSVPREADVHVQAGSTKTTSVVSPRQLALITCRRTDSGRWL